MDKPFRFAIPESIYSVLDWFTEALELEVRRFGNSGVEFSVEGPRSRTLHGSDGHATVMEIVILGFRTLGKPIPSDWAPEYLHRWNGGCVGTAGIRDGVSIRGAWRLDSRMGDF